MVLSGFNSELRHRGRVYHVQTEDNGVNNPQVITLLYLKGAIRASKKTSYRHLLEKKSFQKELLETMKSQHREIMKELLAGKYDLPRERPGPVPETAAAEAAMPKTLDQAILEYLENYSAAEAK